MQALENCKKELRDKYQMSDLGPLHWFLGMRVTQSIGLVSLDQSRYIESVAENFDAIHNKYSTPMDEHLKLSQEKATDVL